MLTGIEYRLLRRIAPRSPLGSIEATHEGKSHQGKSKVRTHLGEQLLDRVKGRVVVDFGCGEGLEAVELARHGARKVIGIDIREEILEVARLYAARSGVSHLCEFTTKTADKAEIIISVDSFEHFEDPAAILRIMDSLLAPTGEVIVSFGPTWYHPRGGHLFSVFPWAHLVFSEEALLRWRSDFRDDGARRFGEVSGGLNQMTIRRFDQYVENSPLRFAYVEMIPIRGLAAFQNPLTREFTTAMIRCRLVKR